MYAVGTQLGRFVLEAPLGAGGHGTVWRARDTLLDEEVALKVLNADQIGDVEARQRLKREVLLARRIQHPRVCRVNDLHDIAGTFAVSMQLVRGQSLDALLGQGQLPMARALALIDGICEGVAAAHEGDVVHRDLKPSNIAVDVDGKPVILDFGIARAPEQSRLTAPGIVVGTLRYVSPETLESANANARSDQYALGVIAWAMLAGEAPYGQPSSAMALLQALEEGPRDLCSVAGQVPRGVADAVHKAMARDPLHRHASVEAFRQSLLLAVGETSGRFQSTTRPDVIGTQVIRRGRQGFDGPSLTNSTVSGVRQGANVPVVAKTPWGGIAVAAGITLAVLVAIVVVVASDLGQRGGAGAGAIVAAPTSPLVVDRASSPSSSSSASTKASPSAGASPKDASPAEGADAVDASGDVVPAAALGGSHDDAKNALAKAKGELGRAASRQRSLGLRRGDVADVDAALAAGWSAIRSGDAAGAAAAAGRAQATLSGFKVDQAFVMAKLQRFNAVADRAVSRTPALKTTMKPAASDVARALGRRDYTAANKALNTAFDLVASP